MPTVTLKTKIGESTLITGVAAIVAVILIVGGVIVALALGNKDSANIIGTFMGFVGMAFPALLAVIKLDNINNNVKSNTTATSANTTATEANTIANSTAPDSAVAPTVIPPTNGP